MEPTYLFLEQLPEKPGEISVLRPINQMADSIATKVGHLLVGWGQFLETLKPYTKNLIAFNGTPQDLPRQMETKRLMRRYSDEAETAFSSCPIGHLLSRDARNRAMKWYDLRNHLAHDQLSWGFDNAGGPAVVIHYRTSSGAMRTRKIDFRKLEEANLDIEVARGRLFQLALHSIHPLPCTSAEKATLRAIVDKGYLKLPKLPAHPSPPE